MNKLIFKKINKTKESIYTFIMYSENSNCRNDSNCRKSNADCSNSGICNSKNSECVNTGYCPC